jgi:RND family efflux transporter MFP subunit
VVRPAREQAAEGNATRRFFAGVVGNPMHRLLAGVTALACLCGAGCSRPADQEEASRAIPVEVLVMAREDLRDAVVLTGILDAYRAVDVVSEVSGTIEALHRDVGARVASGARLATIDQDVPRESLRQAEAACTAARARHRVAHQDYQRDSTLFAARDIAEATFELSRMNWVAARAEMKSAQAAEALAARRLRDTEIRGPFAGYVARRYAELGQFVAVATPLFRLVDIDSLRLVLGVSQQGVSRVAPGMPVAIEADALPDRVFRGHVRSVSPEADEITRTFAVEVILANPAGHPLKDGMVVRGTLVLEQLSGVLAAAREAVLRQGDELFVFVIADSIAERRAVSTGRMIGGRHVILEGLRPGERLVCVGQENLREGSRVEIEAEHTAADVVRGGAS